MKHSHTFRLNERKKSQGFWVFITVWQVFKLRGNRYSSYLFIMTSCGCFVTYIAGLKNSPLIKLKRRKRVVTLECMLPEKGTVVD